MNVKLLHEYNELLVSYKMGLIYLDGDAKTEDKEKWTGKFQDIVKKMDKILKEIDIEYTDTEVMEGFHIEFRQAKFKKYGK